MSLLDCLTPQVPPLPRGARVVQGPASMTVGAAEAAMRPSVQRDPKPPAKRGRPPKYSSAMNADPDLHVVLAYLRSTGAVSVPAIVRATGFPPPKVRYLLRAAKSLGLAVGREGRLWNAVEEGR